MKSIRLVYASSNDKGRFPKFYAAKIQADVILSGSTNEIVWRNDTKWCKS